MDLSRRGLLSAGVAGIGIAGASAAAAQSRGRQGRRQRMLDVTRFGAKPGSRGDQTGVFQQALQAAQASLQPLFIPAGTYRVSTLYISGTVQILGVPGASIMRFSGGTGLRIEDAKHVTLGDLVLEGPKRGGSARRGSGLITARNVTDLTVTDMIIRNARQNGIHLKECSGRIDHVEVGLAQNTGIFSLDATGLLITGCHVHDCGNNGIQIWRSTQGEDGSQVIGNRIENIKDNSGGSGQNGNGVNMFRANNVMVSQNRISKCAFSAIRSNKGSACQMIGNNCSDLGEVALYAEFGFEGAVISGNIVERAEIGVSVTNFNEGGRMAVVSQNIIRDLLSTRPVKHREIGISVEADTAVTGNIIENVPGLGIGLGWGKYLRDVTACNNVIRQAGVGIGVSVSRGAGAALISDNLISGSVKSPLAGYRKSKMVIPDLSKPKSPGDLAHISLNGNLVT